MISSVELYKKMNGMIKHGYISTYNSDTGGFPRCYVTVNNREKQATRFSPYGLDTNPPNKSFAVCMNMNGNESNSLVLSQDVIDRKKDLKEGEVVVHNTLTNSYIFFKENGDMEVVGPNNRTTTIASDDTITIDGNADITVGGSLTADVTGQATITAPTTTINGNVVVNGNLTVSAGYTSTMQGNINCNATISSNESVVAGVTVSTHKHQEYDAGGLTGVPQ